jgi:hypothetical protein
MGKKFFSTAGHSQTNFAPHPPPGVPESVNSSNDQKLMFLQNQETFPATDLSQSKLCIPQTILHHGFEDLSRSVIDQPGELQPLGRDHRANSVNGPWRGLKQSRTMAPSTPQQGFLTPIHNVKNSNFLKNGEKGEDKISAQR